MSVSDLLQSYLLSISIPVQIDTRYAIECIQVKIEKQRRTFGCSNFPITHRFPIFRTEENCGHQMSFSVHVLRQVYGRQRDVMLIKEFYTI